MSVFRPVDAPVPEVPLFDVHVNVGVSDSDQPAYGRMAAADYPALMEASGTRTACVFPPLLDDYAAANRAVRDWATEENAAAGEPRLLPFARLGGTEGPRPFTAFWQRRAALRMRVTGEGRARAAGGLCVGLHPDDDLAAYAGVKMIPHLSGLPSEETFAAIADAGLTVLIHCGVHSPPAWMERVVLPRCPGPVVLAHLGNFPGDAGLVEDAVALCGRHENLYLDTSAAWLANFVTHAAERVPERLLFGSDAPLVHPRVAWNHNAGAVADDAALRAMAHENADRLFAGEMRKFTPDRSAA